MSFIGAPLLYVGVHIGLRGASSASNFKGAPQSVDMRPLPIKILDPPLIGSDCLIDAYVAVYAMRSMHHLHVILPQTPHCYDRWLFAKSLRSPTMSASIRRTCVACEHDKSKSIRTPVTVRSPLPLSVPAPPTDGAFPRSDHRG